MPRDASRPRGCTTPTPTCCCPRDYFEQTEPIEPAGVGAAIYFYDHRFEDDPALAEAARLYEISLRYYVLGLAWAGSPYAYQSMGSCLAIPAGAYAAVRGFPKKNAAEDFYVLDKLAKVGSIVRLAGTPLILEGRPSDRVPFGTGRALRDLVGRRSGDSRVFGWRTPWSSHTSASGSGSSGRSPAPAEASRTPWHGCRKTARSSARRRSKTSSRSLGAFEAVREAVAETRDSGALLRRLHTWFDAFRTLKLLHGLRDAAFPDLGWRQALAEAPFTNLAASTEEDTESLRGELAREEAGLATTRAGVGSLSAADG